MKLTDKLLGIIAKILIVVAFESMKTQKGLDEVSRLQHLLDQVLTKEL